MLAITTSLMQEWVADHTSAFTDVEGNRILFGSMDDAKAHILHLEETDFQDPDRECCNDCWAEIQVQKREPRRAGTQPARRRQSVRRKNVRPKPDRRRLRPSQPAKQERPNNHLMSPTAPR